LGADAEAAVGLQVLENQRLQLFPIYELTFLFLRGAGVAVDRAASKGVAALLDVPLQCRELQLFQEFLLLFLFLRPDLRSGRLLLLGQLVYWPSWSTWSVGMALRAARLRARQLPRYTFRVLGCEPVVED